MTLKPLVLIIATVQTQKHIVGRNGFQKIWKNNLHHDIMLGDCLETP